MKNYDMLTISAQNGGWVRYENFPIHRNGHRLNPVYFGGVHCLTGFWHCQSCKLMGVEKTFLEHYSCTSTFPGG